MLVKIKNCWFLQNVKSITVEFQYALDVAVMNITKIMNVVRWRCTERRKKDFLKDVKIRKLFEAKVIKLGDIATSNLWGHFKDGVLKECFELCGQKIWRGSKGETWWWNVELLETMSRKKDLYNSMCRNCARENKKRNKIMKNKARKVVSKAMREKSEEVLCEFNIVQMECYTSKRIRD